MLNKNQSKKWNFLKFALVLPVLVAFVFLFQMEVIAKEKNQNTKTVEKSALNDAEIYKIDKNTTEAELKEKAEIISQNHGLKVHFSKTKRNANNELTAIAVEIKGKQIAENRTIKSSDPIKSFAIAISQDTNGKLSIDFVEDDTSADKITIRKTKNSINQSISADTQYYIDEEKSNKAEMEELDPEEIESINVIKNSDKPEIRIITKKNSNEDKWPADKLHFTVESDKDAPVPPTPPTPPVMKIKVIPPTFPKAPKAPKGDPITGDKKAWSDFEKQMEEYELKMKKLEPQMESFDKQMAEFDKQMEPFNKEMEVFDEKMKIYEKELKKYLSEKKKDKS